MKPLHLSIRPGYLGLLCCLCHIGIVGLTLAQNIAPTGCPPPPQTTCCNPQTTTYQQTWSQGAQVAVNIDPSFSPNHREAIQQAFRNWEIAGANNGSGVTFTFTFNTTPPSMTPPPGVYNVQVWNRNPTRNPGQGGDNVVTVSSSTGHIVGQEIWINTQTINPCAVAQTTAHEAGHGFGLGEASGCGNNTSVMNAATEGYNSLTGTYGPTDCDNTKVNEIGGYPTQTPTPHPSPTPCAQQYSICAFNADCCAGLVCGEVSRTCIPCEPDPQGRGGCATETCANCYAQGGTYCDQDSGNCWTPILVDVRGDGLRMSSVKEGILFDGFGNGMKIKTAWTTRNSDDAWLVLDRNGNGMIDNGTELFSSAAPQPAVRYPKLKNGFNALAEFDKRERGGNSDEKIDKNDYGFQFLQLWQDLNKNGVSEPSELYSLPSRGVAAISLETKEAKRRDGYGNTFRLRAKVFDARWAQLGRWAWDVFPLAQPSY